jgi:hypothetical protein
MHIHIHIYVRIRIHTYIHRDLAVIFQALSNQSLHLYVYAINSIPTETNSIDAKWYASMQQYVKELRHVGNQSEYYYYYYCYYYLLVDVMGYYMHVNAHTQTHTHVYTGYGNAAKAIWADQMTRSVYCLT